MKKTAIIMLAAAGIGISGIASAADSPVVYLGSSAGGSAYGTSYSAENAKADGGIAGNYSVTSFATQNSASMFGGKDNRDKDDAPGYENLLSLAKGNGCQSHDSGCSAGTWTASSGLFAGSIGNDGGNIIGAIGGESLASVAKIGTDMSVANAEHQSAASIATSGAGTTGIAVNGGHAVSRYSDLGNGSGIVAAF